MKIKHLLAIGGIGAVVGAFVGSRIAYSALCTKTVVSDTEKGKAVKTDYEKKEPEELIKDLGYEDSKKAALIKALYTVGYPEVAAKKLATKLETKIVDLIPLLDVTDFSMDGSEEDHKWNNGKQCECKVAAAEEEEDSDLAVEDPYQEEVSEEDSAQGEPKNDDHE